TPLTWAADVEGPAPRLELTPAGGRLTRAGLAFSGQWLVLVLIVWAGTLSGVLRALGRGRWPEAVVVVGVRGWPPAGPTPAGALLLLLVLGVVGRLLLVVEGARWLLAPRGTKQQA